MSARNHYEMSIAFDDESRTWTILSYSVADRKFNRISGTRLGPLFNRVAKLIRKKQVQAERFPLPNEPSVIIIPPKHQIVAPHIISPNGN